MMKLNPFVIVALLLIGVFVSTFFVDNKTIRVIVRICTLIGLAGSILKINKDLPETSFRLMTFRPMSLFGNKKKKPSAAVATVDVVDFTTKYD